jgi:hypothetical protein
VGSEQRENRAQEMCGGGKWNFAIQLKMFSISAKENAALDDREREGERKRERSGK